MTELARPYEEIAAEYYDALRHPTSANFREASAGVLAEVIPALVTRESVVVEVGCGDSLFMEVLTSRRLEVAGVTLTDSSATMLGYSKRWQRPGVELRLGDAEDLPFGDGSADVLVSVLGDPYNTDRFWSEVHRVLKPRGYVVYTTPSHEWSVAYRGHMNRAVFDSRSSDDIAVSSIVLPPIAQRARIEQTGLQVVREIGIPLADIAGAISPKLMVLPSAQSPVVTGYVAVKPQTDAPRPD